MPEDSGWPSTTYTSDVNKNQNEKSVATPSTKELWVTAWKEFCDTTSIHACRQIAEDQPFILRRILWALLLLAGTTIFVLQMVESIDYYRQWPVAVNVKINYNHTLDFPAVTLCNHNSFRTTVTAAHGWYELVSEMFGERNGIPDRFNLTHYNASDVTLEQLYRLAAHDKYDMIVSCKWGNEECNADDFETTLTDFGVCYTFNGYTQANGTKKVSQTGTRGGLRLHLNVEQYEYMRGPYDGAGVKLLLHRPQEVPLVRDLGVAVMPGTQSFVGIQILQIHNLGKPHGECDEKKQLDYYDEYTSANCLIDAYTKRLTAQCHCKDIFMPGSDAVCTLEQYQNCVIPMKKTINSHSDHDQCPIPCFRVMYDPIVTYASTSNFDLEKMLQSPYIKNVQSKYIDAREVVQKVDMNIVQRDRELIDKFNHTGVMLREALLTIQMRNNQSRYQIKEMQDEMDSRMVFHLDPALAGIVFTVKHDFIRGWEVRDERVIRHVTGPYYETSFTYKLVIDEMMKYNSTAERAAIWFPMETQLRSKANYANMAEDNITQVYQSYANADPMITFQYTPGRRYDLTFMSLETLKYGHTSKYRKQVYDDAMKGINSYRSGLRSMLDIGRNLTEAGSVYNESEVADAVHTFHKGARKYNYRVFMFRERIVNKPLELLDLKVDTFRDLQSSFHSLLREFNILLDNIDVQLMQLSGYLALIDHFHINCAYYMHEGFTISKTRLASFLKTDGMADVESRMSNALLALRSRGRELSNMWSKISNGILDIWTNILEEKSVHEFYSAIRDDIDMLVNDPSTRDTFIPIFGKLLTDKLIAEISDYPAEDFYALLNADVPGTNLTSKTADLNEVMLGYSRNTDVSDIIDDMDHSFLEALGELRLSLTEFVDGHKVDNKFYKENFLHLDVFLRELSYEEIIQEKAYDLTKLLCDIGGSIGLFVGASALSLFEIFDSLINTAFLHKPKKRTKDWIAMNSNGKDNTNSSTV